MKLPPTRLVIQGRVVDDVDLDDLSDDEVVTRRVFELARRQFPGNEWGGALPQAMKSLAGSRSRELDALHAGTLLGKSGSVAVSH